jgi:hypothetical protein
MTTKKKSRPLFEVPAEVESGAQSGWVYRSGAGPEPISKIEPRSREADAAVQVESAASATLAMAMAAIAQAMVLGMTIAAIPCTMGVRTLQSLAKQSD